MLDAAPSGLAVMLRTKNIVNKFLANGGTSADEARLGFYNDCWLSDSSDTGSWESSSEVSAAAAFPLTPLALALFPLLLQSCTRSAACLLSFASGEQYS